VRAHRPVACRPEDTAQQRSGGSARPRVAHHTAPRRVQGSRRQRQREKRGRRCLALSSSERRGVDMLHIAARPEKQRGERAGARQRPQGRRPPTSTHTCLERSVTWQAPRAPRRGARDSICLRLLLQRSWSDGRLLPLLLGVQQVGVLLRVGNVGVVQRELLGAKQDVVDALDAEHERVVLRVFRVCVVDLGVLGFRVRV
jgi:hypothetical protein